MEKRLKLDILGLICSVVLSCICIVAIIVAFINYEAVIGVQIAVPYLIVIGFAVLEIWCFIKDIFKYQRDLVQEVMAKEREINTLKEKAKRKK